VTIPQTFLDGNSFLAPFRRTATKDNLLWFWLWAAKSARSQAMTGTRAIHNLALIGFMGTGKSSVGRQVADALHFDFLDTDRVIEARAGKTVSEIFAQDGEPAFREWERRVVEELTKRTKTVIATGGGLPIKEGNLASLKTHALVVCLWAGPEAIWERTRDHHHRPLLDDPDPLAKIRSLLAEREPHYRQADVLVNTEMRSVREVALQVLHQFHAAQSGRR
jgi:shikimate kinase